MDTISHISKTNGPILTKFTVIVYEKKVIMISNLYDCNHGKLILACMQLLRLFCGKSHAIFFQVCINVNVALTDNIISSYAMKQFG